MAEIVKTIKPSGGDYATLAAWEAGEQRALASGEVAVAECYTFAGGLNSQATFAGWIFADTTSRIMVRAAALNGHGGVPGAGFFLTRSSATVVVTVGASHNVDFQDIEIDGAGYNAILVGISAASIRTNADNLILHGGGTGIAVSGVSSNIGTWNNVLVYSCARGYSSIASATGFFTNNWTVYGGDYGIVRSNVTNCGCFGQTTLSYLGAVSGSNYNISSDTSAPGATKATSKTAYTDYFLDPANGDFHLKGTSLTLFGISGAVLSGTFTTDTGGVTRSAPWDIGAYQYVASGGVSREFFASLANSSDASISLAVTRTVAAQISASGDVAAGLGVTRGMAALQPSSSGLSASAAILRSFFSTTASESSGAGKLAAMRPMSALITTASEVSAGVSRLAEMVATVGTLTDAEAALAVRRELFAAVAALADMAADMGLQRAALQLRAALTVTARDPLALSITERNLLALVLFARDPLALALRLNLIPDALDLSAVYDKTSGGLLYDEPSGADITWRAAS